MINLPRFNFGNNAKGELSVKDVEAVAVNQIRYVPQMLVSIHAQLPHNSPKRGLIHRAYALGWGHRGGSVAAPMMPEMKAPSMQTQEIKLEDRGQTVSSRFRAEVGTQTCHTCVPRDSSFSPSGSFIICPFGTNVVEHHLPPMTR
jgi:hypothetical protein